MVPRSAGSGLRGYGKWSLRSTSRPNGHPYTGGRTPSASGRHRWFPRLRLGPDSPYVSRTGFTTSAISTSSVKQTKIPATT